MDTKCEIGWVGSLRLRVETDEFSMNDVIANHINCPACGKEGANARPYHEIYPGETIECEDCHAGFKPTSLLWWYNDSLTWERIS